MNYFIECFLFILGSKDKTPEKLSSEDDVINGRNSPKSPKASIKNQAINEESDSKIPGSRAQPSDSSSSSEDEVENDDWQLYGKDFVEPGVDLELEKKRSVSRLNIFLIYTQKFS